MWDEDLIRDVFNSVDAGRILCIPINYQAFDDFIAWHLDRSGRFSVRSAYHAEWIHKFGQHANSNLHPGSSMVPVGWRRLWKLQIPHKVQIFGWRALHGILPLKCILANRYIGTSGECPICH